MKIGCPHSISKANGMGLNKSSSSKSVKRVLQTHELRRLRSLPLWPNCGNSLVCVVGARDQRGRCVWGEYDYSHSDHESHSRGYLVFNMFEITEFVRITLCVQWQPLQYEICNPLAFCPIANPSGTTARNGSVGLGHERANFAKCFVWYMHAAIASSRYN